MAGIHVLVVDDDEPIVKVLNVFFQRRGDVCRTATQGAAALQALGEENFDVLLSDLSMPGLDGLELIKNAKSLRPDMACVLMSGIGTRGDVIAAMKVGVLDFVDKPFGNFSGLTFVVERAAEWSRLRHERAAMLQNLQSQNAMLESSLARLRHAYSRLVQQEETLEADLVQAQHVQRKLLPHEFPQLAGMELFGFFGPCERLGGDFFGTLPLGEGRLAVYLADVAGHGVRAAMITVILRELMNARRKAEPRVATFGSPGGTLAFLNDALREEAFDPPILVSMVYAMIDTRTGGVTVASAGHPAPILVSAGGRALSLAVTGPVLGSKAGAAFAATEVVLEPGDFLLLYSDGLPEAHDPAGREFSAAQLRTVAARWPNRPAGEIGAAVESAILTHLAGDPPADDMTFIVINRCVTGHIPDQPVAPSVKVVLPKEVRRARSSGRGLIEAGWNQSTCVIRLQGVCTWQVASALREVIAQAEAEHADRICLDLANCEGMDSTLLGLLYQCAGKTILHQPSARVIEQFHEMGIFDLLRLSAEAAPQTELAMPLPAGETHDASVELVRSAHESLMQLSEENRVRFKDVIEALARPQAE